MELRGVVSVSVPRGVSTATSASVSAKKMVEPSIPLLEVRTVVHLKRDKRGGGE
jgi:hypothetical protein